MGPFANATYLTQNRTIGSWYDDSAWFVCTGYPWSLHGVGYYDGLGAGVYAFGNTYGHADGNISFRVVLTPTGGAS